MSFGKRLDLIAATRHDQHVAADYLRLRAYGIRTVREGIRWHLIERIPYRYDFASVLSMLRTAHSTGMQVLWDLCHFGWPDDLDVLSPEFIRRFARLARAFALLLKEETDAIPFIVPINEISFLAWAGGEVGCFHPFLRQQGDALKAQLVRAAIASIEAIWDIGPSARICHLDPLFHIIVDPARPEQHAEVEASRQSQYQAWDMLCGRQHSSLGGHEKYLDIVGVNYYPWNQWIYVNPEAGGPQIPPSHPHYRPFRDMLREISERYHRPIFIGETGTEGDARAAWLRYMGGEVSAALSEGVPIEGVCLYPIVNFPGWDDERHCHNGLWDYADEAGRRVIHKPLARELRRQQSLFAQLRRVYYAL